MMIWKVLVIIVLAMILVDQLVGLVLDYLHRPWFEDIKEDLKKPTRATSGSAGYDFFAPEDITIPFGGSVTIGSGIISHLAPGQVLLIAPRSGLGFKYGVRLANTIGVIDEDFKDEIKIKLVNDDSSVNLTASEVVIPKGTALAQGIIVKYDKVRDDVSTAERTGGFGSTTQQ